MRKGAHHLEFWEDIRDATVCARVEESDDTLAAINKASQSRPLRGGKVNTRCRHRNQHERTSLCLTGTDGGTYSKSAMPEFWKAGSQSSVSEAPSGFVKMKVRTSFGLARIQVLTVER